MGNPTIIEALAMSDEAIWCSPETLGQDVCDAEIKSWVNWVDNARIEGITHMELIESNTIDISEYVQLHFYDPCWYWGPSSGVDKGNKNGRISVIMNDVGQAIRFTVIPKQISNPLAIFQKLQRSTVQYVFNEERARPEFQKQLKRLKNPLRVILATLLLRPKLINLRCKWFPVRMQNYKK